MTSDPPGADEFETIARLLRPLAPAPEALGLADDAAAIPSRPGQDLIVSKDAMVAGVHFLADDPLDLVARKLLRANLSDLAAKAAEPYGYFLAIAWPEGTGWAERERLAAGLAEDQARFDVTLLGGDTVSTPGPLTLSATILGWTPSGAIVRRSGARPGDRVLVSGTIGDGWLGLKAARGQLDGIVPRGAADWLAGRYRLPEPRLELRDPLRARANAAADVSDGLVADAGHIAETSAVRLRLDLTRLPVSEPAARWLERQGDRAQALAALATGGDDYEVVLTCAPAHASILIAEAEAAGVALTEIGEAVDGEGVAVTFEDCELQLDRSGWRHG
ncbi:MAG TPA: thiamine-phosphate kinase [Caulobacteraceae bacterium]|nr:thiamine-phosphate kinase [Caulobacteraceae bacterium]